MKNKLILNLMFQRSKKKEKGKTFSFYINRSRAQKKTAQKCFIENVKWKRAPRNDDDKMYVSSCLQKKCTKKRNKKEKKGNIYKEGVQLHYKVFKCKKRERKMCMYNFLKLHKVATSTEKALGCAHEDFLFLNLYVQCLSNIVEAVENVQFFFLPSTPQC
jgi:hypothetical protein